MGGGGCFCFPRPSVEQSCLKLPRLSPQRNASLARGYNKARLEPGKDECGAGKKGAGSPSCPVPQRNLKLTKPGFGGAGRSPGCCFPGVKEEPSGRFLSRISMNSSVSSIIGAWTL